MKLLTNNNAFVEEKNRSLFCIFQIDALKFLVFCRKVKSELCPHKIKFTKHELRVTPLGLTRCRYTEKYNSSYATKYNWNLF